MAGSEQMNFLIATNYSTAKINLDQYKSQVPNWMANSDKDNNVFTGSSGAGNEVPTA